MQRTELSYMPLWMGQYIDGESATRNGVFFAPFLVVHTGSFMSETIAHKTVRWGRWQRKQRRKPPRRGQGQKTHKHGREGLGHHGSIRIPEADFPCHDALFSFLIFLLLLALIRRRGIIVLLLIFHRRQVFPPHVFLIIIEGQEHCRVYPKPFRNVENHRDGNMPVVFPTLNAAQDAGADMSQLRKLILVQSPQCPVVSNLCPDLAEDNLLSRSFHKISRIV